jgi:hypothetical protein
MRMPAIASAIGLAVALGLASPACAIIEVTSAGAEYAALHPKPVAPARRTAARTVASGEFQATMDQVFGPGRWRQTSGYRTQAQENALRRQGAGTVAPGRLSLHSVGAAHAPGAYDAVVLGLPLESAAAMLRQAGAFSRVLAEAAHGSQGAHLHIELISSSAGAAEN